MTARLPTSFDERQFLEDPLLNTLDDRVWESFASEGERDIWVQDRLESGRPVPDGKAIFLRNKRLVQHRKAAAADGGWVTKFERAVVDELIQELNVGQTPLPEPMGWYDPPITMGYREFLSEHLAGNLAVGTWPFQVDSTVPDGNWSVSHHDNHYVLEIRGNFRATITTGFEGQIIAVGAGGPGQDWVNNPYTVSGSRYWGGAGGGAGGVTTRSTRFVPGQVLNVDLGAGNSNTAADRRTDVQIDGQLFLRGLEGHPLVNGTSWRSYLLPSPVGGLPYLTGALAGSAPRLPSSSSELAGTRANWRGQAVPTYNDGGIADRLWPGFSLFGLFKNSGQGRSIRNVASGTRITSPNTQVYYAATGGGGAGGLGLSVLVYMNATGLILTDSSIKALARWRAWNRDTLVVNG